MRVHITCCDHLLGTIPEHQQIVTQVGCGVLTANGSKSGEDSKNNTGDLHVPRLSGAFQGKESPFLPVSLETILIHTNSQCNS